MMANIKYNEIYYNLYIIYSSRFDLKKNLICKFKKKESVIVKKH